MKTYSSSENLFKSALIFQIESKFYYLKVGLIEKVEYLNEIDYYVRNNSNNIYLDFDPKKGRGFYAI